MKKDCKQAPTIFSSDVLTEGESPEKYDKEDEDASPVMIPYQGINNLGFKKHIYDPHEPHSAAVNNRMMGLNLNKMSSKESSPSKLGGVKEPNYLDLMPDLDDEEEDGPSFKLHNVNSEQMVTSPRIEDETDLVDDGFFDKLMSSNKPSELSNNSAMCHYLHTDISHHIGLNKLIY